MSDSVAVVNSPEVDAVPRDPARVRHRLMQLGSGKQDKPGRWANYLDLVWIDLFLRSRLLAGIRVDMFGRFNPASFIPLSVIIDLRIILDRPAKVFRIESQTVLGRNIKYGQPPVDLTHRCGIPGVAVRMKCVGNP